MIGKVVLADGNEITLSDEGSIQSKDPNLQEFVETMLKYYQNDYSPAQGGFGVDFLYKLADLLGGGEVSIEEQSQEEEGLIY